MVGKNDIDIYYSDNSKENASYNIIKSMKNSIEIEIQNNSNKTQAIITTDDNGESITFKRNKMNIILSEYQKTNFMKN